MIRCSQKNSNAYSLNRRLRKNLAKVKKKLRTIIIWIRKEDPLMMVFQIIWTDLILKIMVMFQIKALKMDHKTNFLTKSNRERIMKIKSRKMKIDI